MGAARFNVNIWFFFEGKELVESICQSVWQITS